MSEQRRDAGSSGEFEGRSALITGAARGQGRSHAVELARRGADIVAVDVCGPVETADQVPSSVDDLAETVRLIEEVGGRCLPIVADVRSDEQMQAAAERGALEFGKIDILLANAGMMHMASFNETTPESFGVQIDVMLRGVANSIRAVLPGMRERGYGRIVATGSGGARAGFANLSAYCAAKWGVIGLCKSLALEVAREGVTVNVVNPFTVNTMLNWNETFYKVMRPDLEHPTKEDAIVALRSLNEVPIDYLEPIDISHAILYLVSDGAVNVTGTVLDVMAGRNAHNSA
ncbi:mycofactocin-coupled SDR family oxidoreductase [Microbacterium sp. X-17]|uniref:mycofactocin-coupled SDR family oxidoreductase n=1 Tax=Microbacterium sp. X-17 TaxID=3144404 RepID=UPI0031F47C4B